MWVLVINVKMFMYDVDYRDDINVMMMAMKMFKILNFTTLIKFKMLL